MPSINMQTPPVSVQQPPVRHAWKVVSGLTFGLGVVIAIVSYRYLFDLPPKVPIVAANVFADRWLPIHVGAAATALLIGGVQFSGVLRARKPRIHRVTGRVYLVSCLVSAASGLVLASGSRAGPLAFAGFGTLAFLWFLANAVGWRCALSRQWEAHRQWMVRSWALTLSAVTLRLYLAGVLVSGLPFLPSYRAISFLCWVPNLLVAEWLLRRDGTIRSSKAGLYQRS